MLLESIADAKEIHAQYKDAAYNPIIRQLLQQEENWLIRFVYGPYFDSISIIIFALFLTLLLYYVLNFNGRFSIVYN